MFCNLNTEKLQLETEGDYITDMKLMNELRRHFIQPDLSVSDILYHMHVGLQNHTHLSTVREYMTYQTLLVPPTCLILG